MKLTPSESNTIDDYVAKRKREAAQRLTVTDVFTTFLARIAAALRFLPPYYLHKNDQVYNAMLLDNTLPKIEMWSSSVCINHVYSLSISFFSAYVPEMWRVYTYGAMWMLDDVKTKLQSSPQASSIQKRFIMDVFRQRALCDAKYQTIMSERGVVLTASLGGTLSP